MRVSTVLAALSLALGALPLLFADRADAGYNDGGPIVLGNFSQGAYGSAVDHRDVPREEPRRWVRTAALAPTTYVPKATTTAPKPGSENFSLSFAIEGSSVTSFWSDEMAAVKSRHNAFNAFHTRLLPSRRARAAPVCISGGQKVESTNCLEPLGVTCREAKQARS